MNGDFVQKRRFKTTNSLSKGKVMSKFPAITILVALACTSCGTTPVDPLVGVWVDDHDNYQEFKSNGDFIGFNMDGETRQVGVKGKYQTKGNCLTITFVESKNCKVKPNQKHKAEYRITGNQLILKTPGDQPNKFERVE